MVPLFRCGSEGGGRFLPVLPPSARPSGTMLGCLLCCSGCDIRQPWTTRNGRNDGELVVPATTGRRRRPTQRSFVAGLGKPRNALSNAIRLECGRRSTSRTNSVVRRCARPGHDIVRHILGGRPSAIEGRGRRSPTPIVNASEKNAAFVASAIRWGNEQSGMSGTSRTRITTDAGKKFILTRFAPLKRSGERRTPTMPSFANSGPSLGCPPKTTRTFSRNRAESALSVDKRRVRP